jgi:hypothetical protein
MLGGLIGWGGGRTTRLCSVCGQTARVGGKIASLYFWGGLTTWARGRTASLSFEHCLTARECGLTATCGQR